jgi:hypothetical protein
MKPSELRIGNYILGEVEDWKVGRVTAINIMGNDDVSLDIDAESYLITDIQPIPLTEEWLLKFGFTHENTIGGWSKWSNKKMKLLDMKFYFESSEYFIRVEYVHQLQNLYFALTGEELTIKE